jgi:hypothetical protein
MEVNMKGKVRFAALLALAVATVVFGILLASRSEAGGGKPPTNVALVASFRQVITDPDAVPGPLTTDRILGDNKGSYLNGVTGAGVADLYLYNPNYRTGGNLFIYLDNGGLDELGRAMGFLFYERTYSCINGDGVPDSTEFRDFPIGAGTLPVMTRWVQLKTWYLFIEDPADGFYKESMEVLNLGKMGINGNPTLAYVGMSIEFGYPLDPTVSDKYQVGFRWDPVEVEALSVGPNGPTQWAIRPIQDPNVYSKIVATTYKPYVPSRMLWQTHYAERNRSKSYCYGIYSMPFELRLNRMQ